MSAPPAPVPAETVISGAVDPGEDVTGDPSENGNASGREETEPEGSTLSRSEREAVAAAREYVTALDRRDGAKACALLITGAIESVELPRNRGGCASSLEQSIGYRDPRGLPVWESASVEAAWLIAKPSTSLYRAVGIAEPPPDVISPPKTPLEK
ncbi:MAG: hypothetical protein ACR2OC_08885 [Solirubrobacterales bacterium]